MNKLVDIFCNFVFCNSLIGGPCSACMDRMFGQRVPNDLICFNTMFCSLPPSLLPL